MASSEHTGNANTHLANERTFLAWLRTSITLIALGLAAARYFEAGLQGTRTLIHLLAIGLILVGIVLIVIAGLSYERRRRGIAAGTFQPGSVMVVLASVVVLAIGVTALVFVFLNES